MFVPRNKHGLVLCTHNLNAIHQCDLLERLAAARHPYFNDHRVEELVLKEIKARKDRNEWLDERHHLDYLIEQDK